MPASKRELSPPESESKIRKLDEDGDAMPSKVATILNTVNSPERSAAVPRTKKKLSPSPGGNNSRPSSPLSDCSESVSDPPFKKAKLLSTSAFSTVSSEESQSNTSLTQTALTESYEASIGSCTTDFVRRRDGSDKALCIIQCSNKAKAEEPSESNEELPCSPSDPVQADHSYGRVSEMTETDQDGKNLQEFTSLAPESRQKTVTETIEKSTGRMTEYEAEPSHCASVHVLERQKTVNIVIDSCSNVLDNGTSIASDGKEKDETGSEPQSRNATLLDSEKAPCIVENVDPNKINRQGVVSAVQVEGLIEAPTVIVTGESDQDVKYHTEENYHETLVEETCTDFIISDPLLTNNSESVQFLSVNSSPGRYSENSASTVQSVTNLEQTNSTVQFHFDESAEFKQVQDQVSNTFTNTSDCVDEITETLHKNEARQKVEIVTTSNECSSQNITSNEKETSEDHDNHRANDSTPVVLGDSLMENEKPYNEDAALLNGQLSVDIPRGLPEGISYAAVEITSCKTQAVLGTQTEGSSTSDSIKSDCCHESIEPGMPQNISEYQTQSHNDEMTAVSPALQECLCLVPTVEVQSDIQLNTSDQYFKELEVDTFELQEETVKHQPKTIYHPEPSEIIHQEIVLAVNMENTVVSERGPHVSSKIEKENITAESKVVESNHDGTVAVPVSPPVQAVDVQGEIQLNTSDQYFKEPDVETFELQEEIVKHKTKTMNYLESEIVHQEIVVAVNMENSVASEQSTHVSSTIENETITAESEDEVGSNHDGSAVVLVSPPAVETISPPEVTSALSPNMCPQYQEVSETSELTDVDHVEYTAVTEHYIKGPDESLIIHTNTQTNVLPNIISASATEEMHPPSVEMCLDANKASSKIQTFKAHNLQKNRSGGMVASEHQSSTSSEEMPFSSTVVAYESTNPLSSQAEDVQETFISNAFTEHSEEAVAEYYTTTDVPTIETSVEISVRTFTVELDTNNGQDVTTPDSEMGAVNNVDIEELSTDCADTIGMEVRLPEQYTVEEKLSVQEVMTENVDEQTMTVPEESEVAPSIVLTEEAGYSVPFFSEVHRNLSHPENMEGEEMQTESIVVDTLEDNAVISESQKIEGENFITNESAVDANDLTIGTKQVFLNSEEHVQESQGNEETIVPYRQEDVHSVEEPNTNATEFDVKKHENQIVYEPISSPESTTDGDVSTLPETHDPVGLVHTDITNTSHIIYSVSALSTDKEMLISDGYGTAEIQSVPLESPAVISPIEEYEVINGELFQKDESIRSENVLDNQTELQHLQTDGLSSVSQNEDNKMNQHQKHEEFSDNQVMSEAHTADKMQSTEESMVFEQMEQSNSAEDVTVSVTSASEDAPDGQLENTEEKCEESVTASVFSEVLEVTGPETVAGTENSTVTFTTENQEADCTCEEYVILEPVPVTTIHYDIVTQAVAESGLSEEINANTEGIISEVQQTSVVKDNVNEKITQETMVVEEMLENSTVEEVSPRPTDMMEVTPADCEPDVTQPVDVHMEPPECQILEDIEIGREIVVAQEEQEEDSDISIIEKPQESSNEEAKTIDENINETSKDDVNETRKDIGNETSKETISLDTVKKDCTTAENKEPEKPKKQEMNTQARTKARLAALAEQKAAASKRQARREQLNLLALCQEIAEDIATDSMLLKKIEEEKQAAALAAAKDEAQKKENPPAQSQEEPKGALVTPTPERTEVSSPSVTPAEDNTVSQPSTTNAESKAAAEPPKRRFFTSQVSVPLKAHEKKKLTRYQRLRQVELQREKMSWARVKKLKSDQANQMFSEMNWQASMSFSSSAADHVATAPQPVPNLIKPPSPGLSATNQPVPNAEEPKVEVSKPEAIVSEPAKALQTEPAKATTEQKPEADKTELTQKEDPKAEPSKPELRKSSRISKIESTKPASTPPPAKGKVTSKKVLPAVPPPMPNGLNNQSLKIEYKPYKPRPKYSPDDFELDDDPIPPPKACPQAKPTHQMRSNVQGRPASQTPTSSKPTVSTQHSNQLKSNVLKPVGQISGQTRPASSALAHSPAAQALLKGTQPTPSSSKILPTTKVPQKTVSTSPQSKPVVAPTESKPAASSLPQGKPASTTSQTETAASVDQLAPSEITPAVPPDDAAAPAKCKATEDVPVVPVPTKEEFNVSNDAQKSDKNKASPVHPEDKTVAGVHPKSMTESEETDVNKASQLGQDQNVETPISDTSLQKEIKKLKEADKDGTQTIIDAGQKHFGPVACSVCGMLYSAANPEDESQHLLFHNQFISAVKYVGWKKERILSEFPDGKIILVLPDDPKYALKKIEEIREMVDNDLGFQQVESKCPSNTKTFLFISNDKKVAGCLIAEHINEGYRVIEELTLSGSEGEKVMFERQRAWCCSTTAEPAICGISRIWVVNTMRRQGIASRMLDCLRNNFIYGSNLSKDEIAFSDPTPDGKLFATCYFSTSQFLVYNFVNGTPTTQAKPENV